VTSIYRTSSLFLSVASIAIASLPTVLESRASAVEPILNGEVGGGSVLSSDQRNKLDYGSDVQASIRPGSSSSTPSCSSSPCLGGGSRRAQAMGKPRCSAAVFASSRISVQAAWSSAVTRA